MSGFKRKSLDYADPNPHLDEVLFEIIAIGNSVKVSALDPVTNTEVSIVGAANMTRYTLKMNALRKLERVLRERNPVRHPNNAPPRKRGLYA